MFERVLSTPLKLIIKFLNDLRKVGKKVIDSNFKKQIIEIMSWKICRDIGQRFYCIMAHKVNNLSNK